MSTPVLATIAAGLRSALVVDIGWSETTVTGVYEYREITCSRSVKATKSIVHETARLLAHQLNQAIGEGETATRERDLHFTDTVSFEETEDVMLRTGWCRSREQAKDGLIYKHGPAMQRTSSNDALQQAQDLSLHTDTKGRDPKIKIRLESTPSPTMIHVPFSTLSEPTELGLFPTW